VSDDSEGSGHRQVSRTNNPNLVGIANRAVTAVSRRRKDQPENNSGHFDLDANRWSRETMCEVGVQMVRDVREDLDVISGGGCSVCWATGGYNDWMEHQSGADCPLAPLDDDVTDGWKLFKDSMGFPKGFFCWNCLLPTVRSKVSIQRSLTTTKIEKRIAWCRLPPC